MLSNFFNFYLPKNNRCYENYVYLSNISICKLCITQKIVDEYHFLIDCPIYNNSRKICYQKISELCPNFNNMSDKSKFYYFWKMYKRVP